MNTTLDNNVSKPASRDSVKRIAIHELPILGAGGPLKRLSTSAPQRLPSPPFPRHPEKCGDVEPDPKFLPREGNPYRTRVTVPMIARALRGWLVPYLTLVPISRLTAISPLRT